MALPLRVSGDLRDVDAALLVRSLSRSRETGRLAVSDGDVSRSLYFKTGEIVFAGSNDPDDGLGAWLVRAGRLGPGELAALEARVRAEHGLGAILVEDGRLASEELVAAVTAQLVELVEAVLLSDRGRYWFDFGELTLQELIVLRSDARALILAGLRRVRSVARVQRGLQQLAGRRWQPASAANIAAVDLDSAEEQVLKSVTPSWDGNALPPVPGLSPWQVSRTLWALQVVGALLPATPRRETPSPLGAAMPTPRAPLEVPPEEQPLDPEIEAAVREFNDRHQSLFRILRVEIGAGVEPFVRAAVAALPGESRTLFEAIDFQPLGRFQAARLGERLATLGGAQSRELLGALLEAELGEVARMLGEERGRAVRAQVQAAGNPD